MRRAGHVLSVFSTKGGVGKTVLATNLAASLHHHFHCKVALLELAPVHMDAKLMLGSCGVHWVDAQPSPESLPSLLCDLCGSFEHVFVDAGSALTTLSLAAFERSHLILMVLTPDLPAIRHATHVLQQFESAQFPLRMIKVMLNRAESRGSFRSAEVRATLPVEILAEIPSDGRTVSLSINQGLPFVLAEPKARITALVKACARSIAQDSGIFVEHVTIDRSRLPLSSAVPWPGSGSRAAPPPPAAVADPMLALKQTLHTQLVQELDLKRLDRQAMDDPVKAEELKRKIERVILDLMAKEQGFLVEAEARARLVKELMDEVMGLGPLEDLVASPEISDILVNGPDAIYVERRGKLFLTDKTFRSDEQVLTVIERIIAPLGRRIDESNPMVDARLPDGSRVNAIIPPLSICGPTLSIRKFSRQRYTMEDLIRFGTLTPQMASFLRACVTARKNLIVSGGTGSGKTTLLNVLSASIPDDERIITIEDAAELQLRQRHWVPLEARPPNIEGRGQVTIHQLFRNVLRMRPDRIIIGECRGDETLDMLQAMNTGHDGSLTTLHANSPQDVIARLDSLVLMSNVDLPIRAVREQIASAIALIVHTARLSDGSRKITCITEITGLDAQAGVTFQDLFVFRQLGVGPGGEVRGAFVPTGASSSFLEEFRARGIVLEDAQNPVTSPA